MLIQSLMPWFQNVQPRQLKVPLLKYTDPFYLCKRLQFSYLGQNNIDQSFITFSQTIKAKQRSRDAICWNLKKYIHLFFTLKMSWVKTRLLTSVCLRLCGCGHGAGGHSANLNSGTQRSYSTCRKRPLNLCLLAGVKEVCALRQQYGSVVYMINPEIKVAVPIDDKG